VQANEIAKATAPAQESIDFANDRTLALQFDAPQSLKGIKTPAL
jgi:hypothetical protein